VPHTEGPAPELFTFDDVCVDRGGRRIIDHLDDHIHSGHCTGVVGPSGSGKSTLLRLLNRFEEPTTGQIRHHGVPLHDHDVRELRRRVGLVQQHPTLLRGSVLAELRVGGPDLDDEGARTLLGRVALGELPLDRGTEGLSGGEAQRLCLARALAAQPEVLLLDEPTSALDQTAADEVDAVIRSLVGQGLSAILVTHDLRRAAGVCDEVLVLVDGRVVDRGHPGSVHYVGGGQA
jgi:putative ABC transport system ATP-binding protein